MSLGSADAVKTLTMTAELYRYLAAQTQPPIPAQRTLIEATHGLGAVAEMQIPHEQGVFFTLLCRITGARRVVEVGTFTGYSALCFALGLPADGVVVTHDVSTQWSELAGAAWREAGVADRIQFVHGPAAQTLGELPEEPSIDIAFLDADKVGYETYWDLLVPRVRPGGLLLADNVLYYGEAADPRATGNAEAIRRFNEKVLGDARVESVMLPIADGLTIARKI
jgi:caffeoyl-CoA O-methyltransferase